MQQNFTEIFYGPEGTCWALVAPGGSPEEGTTHQGTPGGPGMPWWVVLSSEHPQAQPWPTGCLLVQKKSPKCFAAFGLGLI